MIATVTSKGQVTLPKLIRDRLGLKTGDKIDLRLGESGETAVLIPVNLEADDVFGILKSKNRKGTVSVEEMDAGIAAATKGRRL
ncbi:MAG: AbrB/MazE/SpoVT family DNA-binding domain-containing protein [Myxococcota bacterium]|jgi:AbrB family looped-hinge helix DNA binding protein